MKEIKVGDYIRDIFGRIGKVYTYSCGTYRTNKFGASLGEIVKYSSDIIGLIEVGDYVNGHKIEEIWEDAEHYRFAGYDYTFQITEDQIESIVTKEQFKSMVYRLEE